MQQCLSAVLLSSFLVPMACVCPAGQQPGFFSHLLIASGYITPDLQRHAQTSKESLGVQVNQCIVACKSWQGILNVVRDLAPVMDAVNVSTAIHRMAKLFKYSKVE